MKVLYVAPYRDHTGYGRAAIEYILSLDAAGVDVVCRPVKLNDRVGKLPDRILELESKSSRNADVAIQHILPHMMSFDGRLKNIGLFASETDNFRESTWADRLNQMDEVWLINEQQVQACRVSGVKRPLRVVPHATDITRFQRSYKPLDFLAKEKEEGNFLFYTVGEFVRRKNHAALLKAFHTEFDPSEPVRLVIKTDRPGMSADETYQHVKAFCDEIKRGLKLRRDYQNEIVITDRLSEDEMMRLHSSCDCFVQPSYGEAWSLPAFDALAMGKTPIVTRWGGYCDYISNEEGWLVIPHTEPVFGITESLDDLYTGAENWAAADASHLRRCMREAYLDHTKRSWKSRRGIERAYDFTYETVGSLMRSILTG